MGTWQLADLMVRLCCVRALCRGRSSSIKEGALAHSIQQVSGLSRCARAKQTCGGSDAESWDFLNAVCLALGSDAIPARAEQQLA